MEYCQLIIKEFDLSQRMLHTSTILEIETTESLLTTMFLLIQLDDNRSFGIRRI